MQRCNVGKFDVVIKRTEIERLVECCLGTSGACIGVIEIGVKPSGSQIWPCCYLKSQKLAGTKEGTTVSGGLTQNISPAPQDDTHHTDNSD